jgi:short-subunit dehydrogenase
MASPPATPMTATTALITDASSGIGADLTCELASRPV